MRGRQVKRRSGTPNRGSLMKTKKTETNQRRQWVRLTRDAMASFLVLSIGLYIVISLIFGMSGEWQTKALLGLGLVLGLFLAGYLLQGPPNPNRLAAPFVRNRPSQDEEELMVYLHSKWKDTPRRVYWLASLPFLLMTTLLAVATRDSPPYPYIDYSYYLIIVFMGLLPGIPLCWSVFFIRVWREMSLRREL